MSRVAFSVVELKNARCPPGSIPIRRTRKEDLMRLKSLSKFGGEYITNVHPLSYAPPSEGHWAILQSDKGTYLGAKAWLSFHNISGVTHDQYSGAGITVINGIDGPSDNFNLIMVGWMVHPGLYGDTQTRLTIFWATDGYQHLKCYNHLCPGFIQKSSKYTLGQPLAAPGDLNFLSLSIYRDNNTGDWQFSIFDGDVEEKIGYWPKYIFSSLDGYATLIQMGGSVYSPRNEKSPPMGNGEPPSNSGGRVARIHMIDINNQLQDPKGDLIADDCYKTTTLAYVGNFEWMFSYGGPGGCLGQSMY